MQKRQVSQSLAMGVFALSALGFLAYITLGANTQKTEATTDVVNRFATLPARDSLLKASDENQVESWAPGESPIPFVTPDVAPSDIKLAPIEPASERPAAVSLPAKIIDPSPKKSETTSSPGRPSAKSITVPKILKAASVSSISTDAQVERPLTVAHRATASKSSHAPAEMAKIVAVVTPEHVTASPETTKAVTTAATHPSIGVAPVPQASAVVAVASEPHSISTSDKKQGADASSVVQMLSPQAPAVSRWIPVSTTTSSPAQLANSPSKQSALRASEPADRKEVSPPLQAIESTKNLKSETSFFSKEDMFVLTISGQQAWVAVSPSSTVPVRKGDILPGIGKILEIRKSEVIAEKATLTLN